MPSSATRRLFTGRLGRFLLSGAVVLLAICTGIAAPRRIEYSSYVLPSSPTPATGTFFRAHFRFAGGVVPRGEVEFRTPKDPVGARDLKLVLLNADKLLNGKDDSDAVAIRWRDSDYPLETTDDLILPLMQFIKRDSYIAFTIPVAGFDEKYFKDNELQPAKGSGGYAAKEFMPEHAEFLADVDVLTQVEALPKELKQDIMKKTNQPGGGAKAEGGTFVNADFHVKYQVYLDTVREKKVADVGGLPLRYTWAIAKDGTAIIEDVGVFVFPDRENKRVFRNDKQFEIQYRAVLFFQTAAILRQLHRENPAEFNRFLGEVKDAVARPKNRHPEPRTP